MYTKKGINIKTKIIPHNCTGIDQSIEFWDSIEDESKLVKI